MLTKNKGANTAVLRMIVSILHLPTVFIMISTGILFSWIILSTFYLMVLSYFAGEIDLYGVLEQVFLIFLYVEVVASIKIYFSQNYHFPLRFFIYIGITHMLRHLVISRQDGLDVLYLSLALLVLVASLALYEMNSQYLKQKFRDSCEDHFEL